MSDENLERLYPEFMFPMRCENGCGTVFPTAAGLRSYHRTQDGTPKLICECCAAEIGHIDEVHEEKPEDAPVCKRKPKKHL